MAEAARVALIQEWRTEQAGGADVVAADAERARSRGDLTEAQVMIAEADRLDRSNDAAIATATVAPVDPRDLSGIADELDRRAGEYERDADNGGTPTQTPDELRELAVDARAQAALYRDDSAAQAPAEAAAAPTADGRASAARAEGEIAYDSAERRAHTAAAMRSQGVPEAQISARMTVDASFSTPVRESVAHARGVVPRTRTGRGQGRTIERPEQSR